MSDNSLNLIVAATVQTATLPLELMKAQAQVRYINQTVKNSRPSLFGTEIALKHGVSGLYVGSSTMALRASMYSAIRAKIYLSLFSSKAATDKYNTVSINRRSLYSGLASGVAAFIVTPLDLVLLRQQVDNTLESPRNYRGMFDALKRESKNGFKNLYIGASWNAAKWAVYAFTMMSFYDSFSEFSPRVSGEWTFNKPVSVAVASLFAVVFSMPFDNIKTKLQYQQTLLYKNGIDALTRTLAREGFFGLYVGYWHSYARSFLTGYATIVLVDFGRSMTND